MLRRATAEQRLKAHKQLIAEFGADVTLALAAEIETAALNGAGADQQQLPL